MNFNPTPIIKARFDLLEEGELIYAKNYFIPNSPWLEAVVQSNRYSDYTKKHTIIVKVTDPKFRGDNKSREMVYYEANHKFIAKREEKSSNLEEKVE